MRRGSEVPRVRRATVGASVALAALAVLAAGVAAADPRPPDIKDAAQIRLALEKLNVVGSALMVAAHPDDENTAMLTWLGNGRKVRAAYLSVTRGDGGQNLIGSDAGELMGVIRTQELLAARRIDGAEQFFTRALDFGFSKGPEETLEKWGRERILSDVVWVIRRFRPDIIVNRFTRQGGGSGHGHHTASAILAEEAFAAAADPKRFPEQLQWVKPWQAKRLVWNAFRFGGAGPDTTPGRIPVDVGEYNAEKLHVSGKPDNMRLPPHDVQKMNCSRWLRPWPPHSRGQPTVSQPSLPMRPIASRKAGPPSWSHSASRRARRSPWANSSR